MLRNSWGKANERQLLGLPSVAVTFGSNSTETTKKEVLKSFASVFDTLGVASPRRLVGKMIYIEGCEQKKCVGRMCSEVGWTDNMVAL